MNRKGADPRYNTLENNDSGSLEPRAELRPECGDSGDAGSVKQCEHKKADGGKGREH